MLKKFLRNEVYKNITELVIFSVITALMFIVTKSNSFQVTINYWTNNSFASPNQTLFTPASRVLFSLEYRYLAVLLTIVLILRAINSIYRRHIKPQKYSKNIFQKINLAADSIIYSGIILLIAVLSGLQDLSTIFFVFLSSFIGITLILLNDQRKKIDKSKLIRISATVITLLSWILLAVYSLGTLLIGNDRSTWYVYALDFIAIFYTLKLLLNDSKYDLLKRIKLENRRLIKPYISSLLIVLFLITIIIGLH